MLRRILFPMDMSSFSKEALLWVSRRALQRQSDILIVHVVSPAAGMNIPQLVQEAETTLNEFCQKNLPEKLFYKVIVAAGESLEIIPEYASKEECTFAVIPSQEAGELTPLVRRLAIPQLILRSRNEHFPEEDIYQNIAVAVDLSPERTDMMLHELRDILQQVDTVPTLTLVHGVPLEDAEDSQTLINAAEEALEVVTQDVSSWNTETSMQIVSGQPEIELPSWIEKTSPSLLVVGLSTQREIWQLILGSTAEALIEGTTCPVLVLPTA
ncbi:universal stress protein [Aminobacterium sp. MB27-C1]|jgi:nucleotide-binding universal stress UspA family protein|uniref:universal stress protein n=1 Tax=unclassified Aminobacterium TaxID=2685012 RepID=UPI001BCD0046|nr:MULTISPECIES: universal stress protein [unclassified Aminobacterium]MEA4878244.1 universal stress protein [Aminobacterium sp.]WMI71063.1 universal stress protein [Aminobacterium sp. MB27-C1]